MSTADFHHLYPTGMNPCTLEKIAYAEAVQSWLCTGCGAPKPSISSVDVRIQEEGPADEPITFVSGCGVVLVRRTLLGLLGTSNVEADLFLGEVRGPSGKVVEDWVTVRGRQRVIIRGSSNVSYRRCEACERHVYFAMGTRYLFPAPAGDVSICESDLYGLVVSSSVLEGISLSNWPKLGVERLKVSPKPKDSLGELI